MDFLNCCTAPLFESRGEQDVVGQPLKVLKTVNAFPSPQLGRLHLPARRICRKSAGSHPHLSPHLSVCRCQCCLSLQVSPSV